MVARDGALDISTYCVLTNDPYNKVKLGDKSPNPFPLESKLNNVALNKFV